MMLEISRKQNHLWSCIRRVPALGSKLQRVSLWPSSSSQLILWTLNFLPRQFSLFLDPVFPLSQAHSSLGLTASLGEFLGLKRVVGWGGLGWCLDMQTGATSNVPERPFTSQVRAGSGRRRKCLGLGQGSVFLGSPSSSADPCPVLEAYTEIWPSK